MDKFDALKEAITEELFQREPLATAIMFYLNKHDPSAYREIIYLFDDLISKRLERMTQEALENEASIENNSCDIAP